MPEIEKDLGKSPERNTLIKQPGKNLQWLQILVPALLIGALTLLLQQMGLISFFLDRDRLIFFLDSLGPWSIVGFVLLQVLQVVAAPIPGEVTGLLGGFLYGPGLGIVLSSIGLTMGSFLAFALSRRFGRPLVDRFVPRSAMERFDYLLNHTGAFLVFMLFLIPGIPKDYLCYILGLGHLSTMEFLVIGGTGRLLGTVLLTLGGNYLKLQQYGRFCILFAVALVVTLVALALKARIEALFHRWHMKTSGRRRDAECPDRAL